MALTIIKRIKRTVTQIVGIVSVDKDGDIVTDSRGEPVGNVVPRDADITVTQHNRYLELPATATTWPGDDTFSVSWEASDGITRYRVRMESATAGSKLKICEDASNETQAEAWLTDAVSSSTADVSYITVVNAGVQSATVPAGDWSEWQEFPEGYALSRLDFLGDTAEAMNIWVEAE